MSVTENNRVRCDTCGLFCERGCDEYTPYGCADPENPEPYDSEHVCKKCWPKYRDHWVKVLARRGGPITCGDYLKSRAESEVAAEMGLVYVYSGGVGRISAMGKSLYPRQVFENRYYGTEQWADSYQYIPKADYERLRALPYYDPQPSGPMPPLPAGQK